MRKIVFILLASLSFAVFADKPIFSETKARSIAEAELKSQKVKNYNFDDSKFNEDENRWVLLYWQDMGKHEVRGIMVFVTNEQKPKVEVSFEY